MVTGTTVELQGTTVTAVRPWAPGDPDLLPGLVIPGVINAHLHLEVSWAGEPGVERLPRGRGFPAWAAAFGRARSTVDLAEVERVGREQAINLIKMGVAAICDVGNGPGPATWMAEAGLSGVAHRELLTLDPARLPGQLALANEVGTAGVWASGPEDGVAPEAWVEVRPSPHALFSTAPELVRATVERRGFRSPATIHVAEDRDELVLLRTGEGPYADWLDNMGIDWRWWQAPGVGPVQTLHRWGLLGSDLMLVHGVHLDAADWRLLGEAGAALCLCPRSNQYIGGRLPDVPSMIAAGVLLCLGTDSLGSCCDLDVLGEIPVLSTAFPDVDVETWLAMCTAGAADALQWSRIGRVQEGCEPGLVQLDVGHERELAVEAPARRRWLVQPGFPVGATS